MRWVKWAVLIVVFVSGACGETDTRPSTQGASPSPTAATSSDRESDALRDTVNAALKKAGSFNFTMEMSSDFPAAGGAQQKAQGRGFYSFDGPLMNLITEPVEAPDGTEGGEQRLIGDDLYQYPTSATKPGDKGMSEDYWLLTDASTPAAGASLPFTQQIMYFFEMPERLQIEETITEGDLTTYSGTVASGASLNMSAGARFTITVDEESRPREIVWDLAAPDSSTMKISFVLEDFGVKEKVQPPPKDEVITMEEYQKFLDKYGATVSP